MKNHKRCVKSLSLWVAALVLMACMAGTAHAEVEWEWKIGGSTLTELKQKEAPLSGTANGGFTLAIAYYATEINCSELSTTGGALLTGGEGQATLSLSSCKLTGPPFVTETCSLIEPLSATVKISLVLSHHATIYALIANKEVGKPLMTINFKEGTECPLPLSNQVNGSAVGELEAGERIEQPLKFSPAVETLFPADTLTFGAHPATLKGGAWLFLGEPNKNAKWTEVGYPHSGEFTIGGKTLAERKISKAPLTGSLDKPFTYVLPTTNYEVTCESMESLGSTLEQKNLGALKIVFTKCTTNQTQPLQKIAACQIPSMTIDALALGITHANNGYILIEPPAGKEYFLSYAFPGGTCPFGELSLGVRGSLSFALDSEKVTQTVELGDLAVESALGDGPLLGTQKPAIGGTLLLSLSGELKGETWGVR